MILGVVSDTHVPDRAPGLDPRVSSVFREARVEAILHAGDISTPRVLAALETVAPVHAVRGNRDWVALRRLPADLRLSFCGVTIGMAHGHGGLWHYLAKRVEYMLRGYRLEMFLPRLLETFPDVQVIVFGHTHRAINCRIEGKLVFNPGSAHCQDDPDSPPSVGLLHIHPEGQIKGEIIVLDRAAGFTRDPVEFTSVHSGFRRSRP